MFWLLGLHKKIPQSEWLKQQKVVFSQFKILGIQISVPAGSVPDESSLRGADGGLVLVFTWQKERGQDLVSFPRLTRTLIVLDQGPTPMISFNLHHLHLGPSPNTVTSGVRDSTWIWGEHNSVHSKGISYNSSMRLALL